MLPSNVDNIRLILDINTIAARHRAVLSDVQLGDTSKNSGSGSALAGGHGGSAIGSVDVGFTVRATYDDFIAFEEELEHSLRIIDVTKLSFTSAGSQDMNSYAFTIRTYWLH